MRSGTENDQKVHKQHTNIFISNIYLLLNIVLINKIYLCKRSLSMKTMSPSMISTFGNSILSNLTKHIQQNYKIENKLCQATNVKYDVLIFIMRGCSLQAIIAFAVVENH